MTRRRGSMLDEIASAPWPVGLALGLVGFVFIRSINAAFAPLAWMFLIACALGAAVSFQKARQRKALLDTRTSLDSLRQIGWREFEMLVGEAFRRSGYHVEENGLGGKDGGIDLILYKDGRKTLVQCKQWRSRQVKATTVREMWGLAHHHGADAVKIVCVGDFTHDAETFANGKAIELITGDRLLAMIQWAQVRTAQAPGGQAVRIEPSLSVNTPTGGPSCPRCGSGMARRTNRNNAQPFWGCNAFPSCRGTRPI